VCLVKDGFVRVNYNRGDFDLKLLLHLKRAIYLESRSVSWEAVN